MRMEASRAGVAVNELAASADKGQGSNITYGDKRKDSAAGMGKTSGAGRVPVNTTFANWLNRRLRVAVR